MSKLFKNIKLTNPFKRSTNTHPDDSQIGAEMTPDEVRDFVRDYDLGDVLSKDNKKKPDGEFNDIFDEFDQLIDLGDDEYDLWLDFNSSFDFDDESFDFDDLDKEFEEIENSFLQAARDRYNYSPHPPRILQVTTVIAIAIIVAGFLAIFYLTLNEAINPNLCDDLRYSQYEIFDERPNVIEINSKFHATYETTEGTLVIITSDESDLPVCGF